MVRIALRGNPFWSYGASPAV